MSRVARYLALLRSKTVWGAILTAGAWLLAQPTRSVADYFQAIGMVLTAAGVRDAIQKAINGGAP